MRARSLCGTLSIVTLATLLSAPLASVQAQAGPPPLSANPANLAIFPAKGQTPEQQKADEAAAYDWATRQTGWDPYQAKAALEQQGHVASDAAASAKGGAVRGAAGGAALGAVAGAIAGDAGKGAAIGASTAGLSGGMRSRRAVRSAGNTSSTAVATYQQQFGLWARNYMAAMEAKGYTVR